MKKRYMRILLLSVISVFVMGSWANADEMVRRIIIFQDNVSQNEIEAYAASQNEAEVVGYVPFINGVVLSMPDTTTPESLANDDLVFNVEGDQQTEVEPIGILNNDGEPEEVYYEVLTNSIISKLFFFDDDKLRPWGIMNLYELPYEPLAYISTLKDRKKIPAIIRRAMENSKLEQLSIAIFDTGVDYTHEQIEGYVMGGVDLVNMTPGIPMDDNGHGTHVTATIAGSTTGLANGVNLYAVKVLDENACGEVSTLIMALQWAIDNDIDMVNMSIAYRDDKPVVRLAIQKASEMGLILVAAVGNHSNWIEDDEGAGDGGAGDGGAGDGGAGDGGASDDGGTVNPYPVMYPAAYPQVIGVSAHDAYGVTASFANTGPEVDVTAPGVNVVSASVLSLGTYSVKCYDVKSGTSMATPHVVGTIALMLALDQEGYLRDSPEKIRAILTDTAVDGKLNLVNALEATDSLNQLVPVESSTEKIEASLAPVSLIK
ncbi:S8 family serine peptidase [Desulfonema magnum]|uniref:Peptidase S8/S53 domain-containing protein n=1 Tax=Desulfonema magnum TaxID=45655 RepID=A0A975BEM4_9BACT|nr:S8 family serine peptidase [Desulfonema magnum]QTA84304.1 Peptidase S8/S53 domain-containing protein [Desulfonema magnum]